MFLITTYHCANKLLCREPRVFASRRGHLYALACVFIGRAHGGISAPTFISLGSSPLRTQTPSSIAAEAGVRTFLDPNGYGKREERRTHRVIYKYNFVYIQFQSFTA